MNRISYRMAQRARVHPQAQHRKYRTVSLIETLRDESYVIYTCGFLIIISIYSDATFLEGGVACSNTQEVKTVAHAQLVLLPTAMQKLNTSIQKSSDSVRGLSSQNPKLGCLDQHLSYESRLVIQEVHIWSDFQFHYFLNI